MTDLQIYHHHYHQVVLIAQISLTLTRHVSLSAITLVSPLNGTQCQYRADEYEVLQVGQH